MNNLVVIKASGLVEPYNEEKIRQALIRAHIFEKNIQKIIAELTPKLHDRISTKEITKLLSEIINEICPEKIGHYRLKEAIMNLGPSGFPFEAFVAKLLKEYGYETETGVVLSGKCVSHEIDVLAKKESREFFVECKYHNQPGTRSDIKIALYVKARGDDLKQKILQNPDNGKITYEPWIFTNTKFSSDAIIYAECENVRLTGWNYPKKKSLQNMIEEKGVYPITCLLAINEELRLKLLSEKIVTLIDLKKNLSLLKNFGVEVNTREQIMKELSFFENQHSAVSE